MDSFKLNIIFGWALAAILALLTLNLLSESLFHAKEDGLPGYDIAASEDEAPAASGSGDGAAEAEESIAALLASADVAKGEKAAKKCAACHTFDKGGANKTGPALWDIVNRKVGGVDGFGYSPAFQALAGEGKTWDYDFLDAFLKKPKESVPKTKMNFAGLKKAGDRANLILYLRSLADTEAPLPE